MKNGVLTRIRVLLGDIRTLPIALPKNWDIPKNWDTLFWNVPIFREIPINWDEKIGKIGSGNLQVTPKLRGIIQSKKK